MSAPADQAVVAAFDRVLEIVGAELGLRAACVRATPHWPVRAADPAWLRAADARRLALYLCRVVGNISGAELSRAVGMTRASITILSHVIEDARELGACDELIERLESTCAPIFTKRGEHGT